MKYILLLLLSGQAFAGAALAPDWVSETAQADATSEVAAAYGSLLDAQALALDSMDSKKFQILPFGFQMNEMVTDIAVSRSGLLGVSAMNANAGVELKWKKVKAAELVDAEEEVYDLVVGEDVTSADLEPMADSIVSVVKATGKVENSRLKARVLEALGTVHEQVKAVSVTSYDAWRARNLRLDLNFSASGAIWFIARAGMAVRLRMEWKLKDLPLTSTKMALVNENTKFVTKVLGELNEALNTVSIVGFEPKKIFVGVGASTRRNFFGLWNYNAGFIGWIGFVPVKVAAFTDPVALPKELMSEAFEIGGEEESQKAWWPFRRRKIEAASFQTGLRKSLQTAAFFAEEALKKRSAKWALAEIKTVNEISYTGFFGIADLTTRGNLEIDFKRK